MSNTLNPRAVLKRIAQSRQWGVKFSHDQTGKERYIQFSCPVGISPATEVWNALKRAIGNTNGWRMSGRLEAGATHTAQSGQWGRQGQAGRWNSEEANSEKGENFDRGNGYYIMHKPGRRDSCEGPWKRLIDAVDFLSTEVGTPSLVVKVTKGKKTACPPFEVKDCGLPVDPVAWDAAYERLDDDRTLREGSLKYSAQAGEWNKDKQPPALVKQVMAVCLKLGHRMEPFQTFSFDPSNDNPVAFPKEGMLWRSRCKSCGAHARVHLAHPTTHGPFLGNAYNDNCPFARDAFNKNRPTLDGRHAQLSDTTTATCTWCQRPVNDKAAPQGAPQAEDPNTHMPHGICYECKSRLYPPSIA